MFSDIKELEQEITQFRKNLHEGGEISGSLKEIEIRLTEMADKLEQAGGELMSSLDASRLECGGLTKSASKELRESVGQVRVELEKQSRSAEEQARALADAHRAALKDIQEETKQSLQREHQIYLDEIRQASGRLLKEQTEKFSAWESAADRLAALMEQNARTQNEQALTLLDKLDAMDLSAVNEQLAKLRTLVLSVLGLSICTLAAAIAGIVLR